MVFEDEINHFIHSERYYVEAKEKQLSLDVLIKTAATEGKNFKVANIKTYSDKNRSVEISIAAPEEKAKGEVKNGQKPPQRGKGGVSLTVYINPYNGKVLDVENKRESFFKKVEMIHRFLLSRKEGVGHYIMSYSSFFFFFILLTGLILWWPKNKAILKQRLKIKWNGTTKRLTHDLHIVTGFYTSVFLIVIVMTGLVMSFNWINKGIFTLTGSSTESPKPPQSQLKEIGYHNLPYNKLQTILTANFQDAESVNIRMPKEEKDAISVNVSYHHDSPNKSDTYYLDQYSGKILGQLAFADKNIGQKIRSYIKPIHTGEVFGLTSKIINFIIVLLTLTFPVTGVMMWLNRIKKKKKKVGEAF